MISGIGTRIKLLEKLIETQSAIERNEIAIQLADDQFQAAIPAIIALLGDEKTNGARGSLLYALRLFKNFSSDHRSEAVEVARNLYKSGGFEVKREAKYLIVKLSY